MATGRREIAPLSAILLEVLTEDETVTLGELIDRMARRGFGLLMIAFALPTLFPLLPPGSAAVIGLLYVLLSVQMLVGLDRPWLPRRARTYRLSARVIAGLRRRGVSFLQRLERFSRPRPLILDERIVARIVAVPMLILGIVLVTPLPFLNTLPALAVLLLGIGLLNRDSVFLFAGMLLATAVLLIIAFGATTLYVLFQWLLVQFGHLFGR